MSEGRGNSLSKARILVVEDEYWVASELAVALKRQGAEVLGPVGTLADAERILDGEPIDCAILDLNLHGDTAFELANRLRAAGVPMVFSTGYGKDALPPALSDVPRLQKPFDPGELISLLPQIVARPGKTAR